LSSDFCVLFIPSILFLDTKTEREHQSLLE